jgi:hypothetical protein
LLARPYPIPPESFLQWCEGTPGALRLAHVEQPVHGHFSAYIDVSQLLNDGSTRDRLIRAFVDTTKEWLQHSSVTSGSLGEPSKSITISVWHPGPPDDHAGLLAQAIHEWLSGDATLNVDRHAIAVPRMVAGSRWIFPDTMPPLQPSRLALVIDWGSLGAVTVQQMIRLAVGSGAEGVLALVLLSQMPVQEEQALTMLRSVRGWNGLPNSNPIKPIADADPQSALDEPGDVPAGVRFMTTTGIGALPLHECSICEFRERLAEHAEEGPTLIREHVRAIRDDLRPHGMQEVSQVEPRDLFGVRVTSGDAAEYLRVRGLLMRALHSTSERQDVLDNLKRMVEQPNPDELHAWLRLIAAERHWLRLPPAHFAECRILLAELAERTLLQAEGEPADVRLRQQAAMVLAAAAPDRLADRFATLVTACLPEPLLLAQLFYEAYTCLGGPAGDPLLSPESLRRGLAGARAFFEQQLRIAGRPETYPTYEWTLAQLIQLADMALIRQATPSPMQAWAALIDGYRRSLKTHEVGEAMTRILMGVNGVFMWTAPLDANRRRDLVSDWRICEGFLAGKVLPYLESLKPILTGPAAEHLSALDDRQRLAELTDPSQARQLLADIGEQLIEVVRWTGERDKRWTQRWEQLSYELEWLYKTFLSPGASGEATQSTDVRRAILLGLLDSCPADLGRAIDTAIQWAQQEGLQYVPTTAPSLDRWRAVRVFCHQSLLNDTISHLIENAAGPKHRAPDDFNRPNRIHFQLAADVAAHGECIAITVANDGTIVTAEQGVGLQTLARKLASFGGKLEGHRRDEDSTDWTYEVSLTLPLWQ